MENHDGRDPGLRTEPLTPIRSIRHPDPAAASYSQPNEPIPPIESIHLPQPDLAALQQLIQRESRRGSKPGSRPGSVVRKRRRSLTYLSGQESRGSMTPQSRARSPVKSRRRSSIMVDNHGTAAYNPGYSGPITAEYLRFFCQVIINEKEQRTQALGLSQGLKDLESGETIGEATKTGGATETGEKRQSHEVREQEESLHVNESLLIPSIDDLMKSPQSSSDDENPFLDKEGKEGPKKAFSYLERILAAQASKKGKGRLSYELGSPGKGESGDILGPEVLGPVPEVLEPVPAPEEPAPKVLEPAPEDPDELDGLNDDLNADFFEPEAMEQADLGPEPALDQALDLESDHLVNEEFLINDTELNLEIEPRQSLPRVQAQTRKRPKSTTKQPAISLNMVKDLVQTLRPPIMSDSEGNSKKLKLDTESIGLIQEQSNIFLQTILSDLEGYALHRTANKDSAIDITDVMLYLRRLKFPGPDGSRGHNMTDYSNLARTHLPLELLMDLDNNLKNAYMKDVSDSDSVDIKESDEWTD